MLIKSFLNTLLMCFILKFNIYVSCMIIQMYAIAHRHISLETLKYFTE